ncbi:tetratricopeptide repeat protein [Synechococcus sp. KORDI-100]|uniref:tetratricopeptide repeat protein n=1 Tax=Synechococcus sp. KORDI-100 TaxID=1280380 RepID=UPI000B0653E3|nr:tetratricopeptide repeat protein [Synechococcus sp. KORDI-100]
MPRVTTAFAAALALFLPIGRPLLVGLIPVAGIGAGLLSTQTAYAQSAQDWFDSGIEKAMSGDYQGAIADYTKAIEINPQYADAYLGRGLRRYELGDLSGAISDYTKAIKYKPDSAHAYISRGTIKSKLKDYQGAITDYTKAIEVNPRFYMALLTAALL